MSVVAMSVPMSTVAVMAMPVPVMAAVDANTQAIDVPGVTTRQGQGRAEAK